MQNVYIYDDNFISLLNLIYYLLKHHIRPDNIKDESYQANLFENKIYLSIPKDEKILDYIRQYAGGFVVRRMFYVFLSNENNKELILYYFFLNAMKYRYKVMGYRNLKCVSEVFRISEYVSHESHKMKGFLRFKELHNHVLYAEMEPTNDVLFLVSCHFAKRLGNELWIIKDNKRKILSIYDKKQFIFVSESEVKFLEKEESNEEKRFVSLWKTFYNTIGITQRKNERCRMNFMPKKYWKYITEMKEEL